MELCSCEEYLELCHGHGQVSFLLLAAGKLDLLFRQLSMEIIVCQRQGTRLLVLIHALGEGGGFY